jgi:hypothetical protein
MLGLFLARRWILFDGMWREVLGSLARICIDLAFRPRSTRRNAHRPYIKCVAPIDLVGELIKWC